MCAWIRSCKTLWSGALSRWVGTRALQLCSVAHCSAQFREYQRLRFVLLQVGDHWQFTSCLLNLISTPLKSRQIFFFFKQTNKKTPKNFLLKVQSKKQELLFKSIFCFWLVLPGLNLSSHPFAWEVIFCRHHDIAAGKSAIFLCSIIIWLEIINPKWFL